MTDAITTLENELINRSYLEGKKAGIREVVEWIKRHDYWVTYTDNPSHIRIDLLEWQAKLKDWGIE